LSDLIVESGIYVSCTVEHNYVISKQFNRAVRVLTPEVAEAFFETLS
jgi:hypothetical protein